MRQHHRVARHGFIDHAAPDGSGDGSSWAQPAALQQALALANGDADLGRCYEIRLRQGVYKPGPAGRPELHFAIDRPLQIKGGYTGNAAQPDERVLHASNTVLSGDIGGDDEVNAQGITEVARFSPTDGSTPLPGNQHVGINSYHVVVIGGAGDDSNGNGIYSATEGDARFTLLEGLTLTAGGTSVDWGTIPEFDSKGSGLLCNGAGAGRQCSPALRHGACICPLQLACKFSCHNPFQSLTRPCRQSVRVPGLRWFSYPAFGPPPLF